MIRSFFLAASEYWRVLVSWCSKPDFFLTFSLIYHVCSRSEPEKFLPLRFICCHWLSVFFFSLVPVCLLFWLICWFKFTLVGWSCPTLMKQSQYWMLQFAQTNKTVFELTSDYIFISLYSPSVFTLTLNGKKLILNGHFHPTWWLSVAVLCFLGLFFFGFTLLHWFTSVALHYFWVAGFFMHLLVLWCLEYLEVAFFYVANMVTCASIGTSRPNTAI